MTNFRKMRGREQHGMFWNGYGFVTPLTCQGIRHRSLGSATPATVRGRSGQSVPHNLLKWSSRSERLDRELEEWAVVDLLECKATSNSDVSIRIRR